MQYQSSWRMRRRWLALLVMSPALGCSGSPDFEDPSQREEALRAKPKTPALASPLLGSEHLIHGIAADKRLVFVTEPLNARVVAYHGRSGRELGTLPAPPEGFGLPFALRISEEGRLVVLDAGAFPNPSAPGVARIYEYEYDSSPWRNDFHARLQRSVRFDGIPIAFAEDMEVLPNGSYVVSDAVLGALWVVEPSGAIRPGIAADTPGTFLPALASCTAAGPIEIDGIPFAGAGNFSPGVGALAVSRRFLYFASSCNGGGIYRVPVATLGDSSRSPAARAADIELVSPSPPGKFEVIKGLALDRTERATRTMYALETFDLRLVRVDLRTGAREVLATDPNLFNFPVATALVPSAGVPRLLVSSDQEHRFAGINVAIAEDMLQPPFLVTEVLLPPSARPRGARRKRP